MDCKPKFIFLAICVSIASCGPIETDANTDDKIIEPEDGLEGATTPAAPVAFLENWDDWKTWEAPEKIVNMTPYFKSGYDYDGLPIIVAQYGKWNYRELARLEPDELNDYLRRHEQQVRRAQTEGVADNNTGIVYICDWDSFTLEHYASSKALQLALKGFTSMTRLNDAIRYGYLINNTNFNQFPQANFGAETFVNMARPFIGNMMEKFQVYGARHEQWRAALFHKIPSSQLPPEYGGDKDWKPAPWKK